MYVVDSSARKATITLTGEEVAVKFPCTYSVFGIKGDSMLLYPKSGMAQGDDGVYDTAEGDGSVIMCLHYQADTVYIKGTGDCVIWAGNSTLDNPFSSTGKGGGGSGGDNTHYKGTTTTAIENGSTTNPITIDGEEYTAVFGDIVVYNYTEFVFDGTTWSEFGRPFDTVPTSGSANAVTSDGVYQRTPLVRGAGGNSAWGGESCNTPSARTFAYGIGLNCNRENLVAFGKYNTTSVGDLLVVGNGKGYASNARSNAFEVNATSNGVYINSNGEIRQDGVPIRATTMPTITASMLGKVVQYVGASDSNYKQGWNYVAVSDGAAEPTYSWQALMDSTPTSGSNNPVTSDGIYQRTPLTRGNGDKSAYGGSAAADGDCAFAFGYQTIASRSYSIGLGLGIKANQSAMLACGKYNNSRSGDLFNVGNGSGTSARSNIVEVNSTEMNVNGDIQRDGVGIDDYTTTERKIGKWIDGSDLYQRTFEVTGLVNRQFNNAVLGTSDIDIKTVDGYIEWTYNGNPNVRTSLDYNINTNDYVALHNAFTDINIKPNRTESGMAIVGAVITIKYTKPAVQTNTLNNIQQTEEPTDEMR